MTGGRIARMFTFADVAIGGTLLVVLIVLAIIALALVIARRL